MLCDKCGKENNDDVVFCVKCGSQIAPDRTNQEKPMGYGLSAAPETRKNFDFKNFLIGIVGVAIAIGVYAGLSFLLSYFFAPTPPPGILPSQHPVAYVKEGSLYISPYGTKKTYMFDENCKTDEFALVSEDGKHVFYTDENDSNALYYKKVSDHDGKSLLLAKNVSDYSITKKGKTALYLRAGSLYVHDLKESRKIDSDVIQFYLSRDEKCVLYNKEDGVYVCKIKKGNIPEKIDTGIDFTNFVSERVDYKKIVYVKDGTLFLKTKGKISTPITSNISAAYIVDKTLYTEKDNTLYKVKGTKLSKITDGVLTSEHYKDESAFVIVTSSGTETKRYIVRGSTVYDPLFNDKNISVIRFSSNGKYMYAVENGDMYEYRIGRSKLGNKKLIKNNVNDLEVYEKNILVFSGQNEKGVFNGRKYVPMSQNCSVYEYCDGTFYYIDMAEATPSLKRLRGSKTKLIDTEVYDMDVRRSDYVVYTKDYDSQSKTGDVHYIRGVRKVRLDQNASHILETVK